MPPNHMKQQAYKHLSKGSFEVADIFFVYLQPYKQTSLEAKGHQNISPKFYGSYQVLQRIGQVAYKLSLPSSSKNHPVFHVSFLNKVVCPNYQLQSTLLELDEDGFVWLQLAAILKTKERQLRQHTIKDVMVQWKDTSLDDGT